MVRARLLTDGLTSLADMPEAAQMVLLPRQPVPLARVVLLPRTLVVFLFQAAAAAQVMRLGRRPLGAIAVQLTPAEQPDRQAARLHRSLVKMGEALVTEEAAAYRAATAARGGQARLK